jgi:hypothetical protein
MYHDIIVVVLSWPRLHGKFILNLQIPSTVQSLPMNTSSVDSIDAHRVIYTIQQYIKKFVRGNSFSL